MALASNFVEIPSECSCGQSQGTEGEISPYSPRIAHVAPEIKRYNKNAIWGSSYEEPTASGGSSLQPLSVLPEVQEEVEVLENRDCCPAVTELIHPLAGVSRSGLILEIYRGENKTQKFYQTSCRRDVKDKPCRFVRSKYELSSRCTQEYSYTYAIVRDLKSNGQWRMDHIRVRSGCACKVTKVTRQRSQEVRKKRK
ncbi:hypothetical protein BIW11_08402 [Tropilaelaps mercedesae]|uniref:Spaetzle domain-containing protein n=1 Tax=Tropilaelaps mercedesae TaxID=418985 RepID=A0A1V9XPV7_9ACAR|nr:hypothetical protein BIW11_08402 [Tropilaelaps mercedesae]